MNQVERANQFKKLHVKGDPLILFNIWDAGSAKALQEVGAKAIATGSWSVAAGHGFEDGEKLPFEFPLENLKRIVSSVSLPVTIDLESGYGKKPNEVQSAAAQVIEAGAIGINFEDQIIDEDGLYSIQDQSARIQAIRETAEKKSVPLFINARTDIFLKAPLVEHSEKHLDEAIKRTSAYAKSGASGLFAPGLANPQFIEKLCELSALPVNIIMFPKVPSSKELAKLGVARISYGPIPYRQVIEDLKEAGRKALAMSE